jgi:tetratricopeptide (TPR) repeat protein
MRAVKPAEVPAQLPRDASSFAGRADVLSALWTLLEQGTGAVPVISGQAGAGKTALAVHWANQVSHRFPDGQLYADLRGSAADDVLVDFLVALGVPRHAVPGATASRGALYRSTLAGRRVLIVLDDARDGDQVRQLLPGGGGSLVIVTSRDQLDLVQGRPVPLAGLSDADAADLLSRRLGRRRRAGGTEAIVAHCDRLPLNLAIVAARAAAEPGTPLAQLTAEPVLPGSYRALPPDARALFRVFGVHPGPSLDLYAAANLAGLPLDGTRRAMGTLARRHLVTQGPDLRYRMHGPVRAYAAETARAELAGDEARAAVDRLLAYYRHAVLVAYGEFFVGQVEPEVAEPLVPVSGAVPAAGWAEAERADLVATVRHAAEHGHFAYAHVLAGALMSYLNGGGHSGECLAVAGVAVAAARAGGDTLAEALAIGDLAGTLMRFGRYAETIEHAEESLHLLRSVGAESHQARMLAYLAEIYTTVGDVRAARRYADAALDLGRRTGEGHLEALGRLRLAVLCRDCGELDDAVAHAAAAVALFQEHPGPRLRAESLMVLGTVHLRRDALTEARRHLLAAHDLLRAADRPDGTLGWTLNHLARLARRFGNRSAAARYLTESLELARSVDDPGLQADTLTQLSLLRHDQGEPQQGVREAEQALVLSAGVGHPYEQALASNALGELWAALGQARAAREHFAAALELAGVLENPYERERARAGLAALNPTGV